MHEKRENRAFLSRLLHRRLGSWWLAALPESVLSVSVIDRNFNTNLSSASGFFGLSRQIQLVHWEMPNGDELANGATLVVLHGLDAGLDRRVQGWKRSS
jgi:hypothetical protein